MKVGDYVRFKTLSREIKIGKVIEIVEPDKESMKKYCVYDLDNNEATVDDYVIKSSPNIIDLIEVGDYVNGERIKALKGDIERHKINNEDDVVYTEYINDYDEWCGYEEDEIKSIVTHEQFSQMEYRIEEK